MSPPTLRSDRRYFSFSPDAFLAGGALLIGTVMAWYVYAHGLTKALTDESAHLNFAQLTFNSMTPGVSQLGFWPPLLHLLLIPFVAIPFLYNTGLAGAFVLVPCLALSTVLISLITRHLTDNRFLGMVAAVLFLLNPYILYYSATPMMEMLYITSLFLSAYLMLRWLETDELKFLLGTGIVVTVTCLSRFEGFLLIPIMFLILFIRSFQRKMDRSHIESLAIMLGLLMVVGMLIIMMYGLVYGGSPFAFAGGSWLRDPGAALRPARFDIPNTLRDSIYASYYMLGEPLVYLAAGGACCLAFFKKRFLPRSAVLLILASPLFFVFLALFFGMVTINVPEFAPYTIFHNERYALTWIGFAIVTPLVLLHEIRTRLLRYRTLSLVMQPIGALFLAGMILFTAFNFYSVAIASNYAVIRRDINSPIPEQTQVATYLQEHYTGGKILTARADNDPILAAAGIPLDRYIYEANDLYFAQTIKEPWFFATWVLMHTAESGNDDWVKQNEPIYKALGNSQEFLKYYDLVLDNGQRKLYRLNENHLLLLTKQQGYNPAAIPSLNPSMSNWNTATVYAQMKSPTPTVVTAAALPMSKEIIKSQLLDFYWNRLKPDYQNAGYVVNEQGDGNSESQSYALMQSLAVDDSDTFDKVWQWTQKNLQQPDGLFAWQFTSNPQRSVIINDAHSATDADTDIAYALLTAGDHWFRPAYKTEALRILQGIWDKETVQAGSGRHVVAGNWKTASGTLVLNPSYFSPAAYRAFQEADPSHDWLSLIGTGYDDLSHASAFAAQQNGLFLPPDWVIYNVDTNTYGVFTGKSASLDYSFDAFRVFWRIAQDVLTSHDPRGIAYLQSVHAFDTEWQKHYRICTLYLFSKGSDDCYVDMGTLAGATSFWNVQNPALSTQIMGIFALGSGNVRISNNASFYERSWYWFMMWQWSHTV